MSFFSAFFDISEYSDKGNEIAVCCPFPHYTSGGTEYYESRPSAHVNIEKNLFHCKVCDGGCSEAQFIAKVTGCSYTEAQKIKRCFQNDEDIFEWDKEALSDESKEKALSLGISEEVINELKIKTHILTRDTLAFPVFMYDHLVDVRTYNQGHTPKVVSRKDSPVGLIIPFDLWRETPKNKWTILCAGEKDMAVARSHGLNAITLTGGENTSPILLNEFKDRKVAIVYDNDGAGIHGARKLAKKLSEYTDQIKVVTNFHELCCEEHEDITDFFTKYRQTKQDLINFIEQTEFYKPEEDPDFEVKYPIMSLLEASNPDKLNKIVQTNIQVVSVSEETFACPKAIYAEKIKDSDSTTDIMFKGECKEWSLNDQTLKDVLHLIDGNFTEEKINEHIRKILGILNKEKYVSIKILEQTTVFKAYITDLFETTDDVNAQPMEYTVYSIGKKLESGKKYLITHKLIPHPYKGQQLISIAIDFKQANDSVTDFKITDKVKNNLAVIQNLEGSVEDRINTLTQKVKGIIGYNGNETLIKAIDLSYNTALQFNFNNFKNVRGYLDTLIISESRVGKSTTSDALRQVYGLGAKTSLAGNSATIPGLVGGSNKTATGYQTRAGVIPQNHRGLIIFEEFGKSSHEISSELTDIRSSNEVRIARVSGTLTLPALVRMITLTNPKTINKTIKSIASYPNGFAILTDLVETAEDIARYDMIVILPDKGSSNIDVMWEPEEPLDYEIYKTRIRWIWSRSVDQIIIEDDVKEYIIAKANELNEMYECHIKIFGTEAWKKLTRLAIAVAGYLVSTDNSYETIIVQKEHIDFAVNFYISIYDNPTFKLKEYVDHERQYSTIDDDGVMALQELYDKVPMLLLQLEQASEVSKNVLKGVTGLSEDDINKALNILAKGLFIKFSNYSIIPTERFRKGIALINKKTYVRRVGEPDA